MSRIWQLQEAKNKFSEVVEAALNKGPQLITRRGTDTAVVLSYTEYRNLVLIRKKLSDFFRESPFVGVNPDLTRDPSPVRTDPPL
jgi:prevent-host-death family protein